MGPRRRWLWVGAMLLALLVLPAARARAAEEAPAPVRVTWKEALARAEAHNPSVTVAVQEIARADALVREARGLWLPTLSANGSYTILDSARMSGGVTTVPRASWNANLLLGVPLVAPLAGPTTPTPETTATSAVASAADVKRQIAAAVGRTYLAVLLQHRQLDVASRASRDRGGALRLRAHAHDERAWGTPSTTPAPRQELHTNEAQLNNGAYLRWCGPRARWPCSCPKRRWSTPWTTSMSISRGARERAPNRSRPRRRTPRAAPTCAARGPGSGDRPPAARHLGLLRALVARPGPGVPADRDAGAAG